MFSGELKCASEAKDETCVWAVACCRRIAWTFVRGSLSMATEEVEVGRLPSDRRECILFLLQVKNRHHQTHVPVQNRVRIINRCPLQ